MTSHDNNHDILNDQKLHDLLKAEAEIDRQTESRRGTTLEPVLLEDEDS